jgi:hypothetical protein
MTDVKNPYWQDFDFSEYTEEELLNGMRDYSECIIAACPRDEENWDDPEDWSMDAVYLAYYVEEYLKRKNNVQAQKG